MTGLAYVGLDLSLTGAGIALALVTEGDAPEIKCKTLGRKGTNSETLAQRWRRIDQLARAVDDLVLAVPAPIGAIAIEAPAYSQSTGKTHDRSGLWWEVYRRVAEQGPTFEVGTGKVKIYATGKGTADKDEIIASTVRRYPTAPISNNNEADAVVLAAIAARVAGASLEPSMPKTHLRALDGLTLKGAEMP